MKPFAVFLVLVGTIIASLFTGGCRDEEGYSMLQTRRTEPSLDESDDPPDTWKDPPKDVSQSDTSYGTDPDDEIPDTLPSGVDYETYATDVLMTAGCGMDLGVIAVAANHERETMCEALAAIAACSSLEGDYFEVGATFSWTSLRPDNISLSRLQGTNDTLAYLRGNKDVFDANGVEEPTSTVIACTFNDCPEDVPDVLCQPMACATRTAVSVVNIEGAWQMSGISVDPGTVIYPIQEGRTFEDPFYGVVRGIVGGTTVSFEIGDYRYEGTISSDRAHMSGHVIELMGFSVIGTWYATRVTD